MHNPSLGIKFSIIHKLSSMIDYAEDIEVFPVKTTANEVLLLKRDIPAIIINGSQKIKIQINKPAESIIPLDKWIMPEQPEQYLKSSRHDFL